MAPAGAGGIGFARSYAAHSGAPEHPQPLRQEALDESRDLIKVAPRLAHMLKALAASARWSSPQSDGAAQLAAIACIGRLNDGCFRGPLPQDKIWVSKSTLIFSREIFGH